MTPREKLAQLQRESKPSKFGNRPIYACKSCWKDTGRTKKWLSDMFVKIKHSCSMCPLCQACNNGIYSFDDIEIFDSKTEHTRGYGELKPLETAGIITDLKHHEKFKLWPRLWGETWIRKETGTRIFSTTDVMDDTFDGAVEIPHRYRQWESDFTYMMKGEKVAEEVKRLTKIEVFRTKVDRLTCEPVKIKEKIDFPYFTNDEDFRHFKKVCELMLGIHGHKVQVRAGGQLWMFNKKWELESIHGRIK